MTIPKTYDECQLRGFGRAIMAVTEGRHLSREETKEIYRQILLAEQPELQQGAFLAAHMATSPTPEEIAGAWEAQMEYDVESISPALPARCADIVGTGSDYLKTINVSSGAAILAAAAGAYVAKKGPGPPPGSAGPPTSLKPSGWTWRRPCPRRPNPWQTTGSAISPGRGSCAPGGGD